jgi:hypothetical protein
VNVFTGIYLLLLLSALLIFSIRVSRHSYYKKWILLYLLASMVTTLLAVSLVRLAGYRNNLFLFHFFTPVEYILLATLYYQSLKGRRIKKLVLLSIPLFIAYSVFSSVAIQKFSSNNSSTIIIESILMILWSLLFLREVLLYQEVMNLTQFAMFWITVGILFYFTGNLVIEGMLDYMIRHSMELARRIYRFSYLFSYLLFILFSVGGLAGTTVEMRKVN